jgi:hypothetical protein
MAESVGGMVIFGAGLESSRAACSLGIYLCIIFYASSKALIYLFLGMFTLSSMSWSMLIIIVHSREDAHRLGSYSWLPPY